MKNNAGQKVRDIIRKEFDSRMEMAVITYILDYGWKHIKELTEKKILEMKSGTNLISDDVIQSIARAGMRICNECNQIEEFLPFIVNYLYVPNAKMREIELSKHGLKSYEWEELIEKFDLEYEEDIDDIDLIVLNANVIETVKFE
jgi:hypothetical protein